MHLENGSFTVEISVDSIYSVGSADNRPYDVVLTPTNLGCNDWTRTFAICVMHEEETYTIALTGGFHSYVDDCALLEGNVLTVLQDHALLQIDLVARTLISYYVFECDGCTFGLYSCPGGYLVYGELEILKFNTAFQESWRFSGNDIFVTQDGQTPFCLDGDRIKLCDWEGCHYELDLDGRLMRMDLSL